MKKNNSNDKRTDELERFQQVIQYKFNFPDLLDQALSHSSYVRECRRESICSNERLEFLGDAFFDAVIGEILYNMYPEAEEGRLSKMRASIVCEQSLAGAARRLSVGDFLLLGKGEEKNGGAKRDSILADATEAVVGAIYLDGGYESVKTFVSMAFAQELQDAKAGKFSNQDYKSALQELLQARGITDIHYIMEKEEGPDHNKTFTVQLQVRGKTISHGIGKSKKSAEQEAARDAIERGVNVF